MLTNKQIHQLAEKGYAKRSGKSQRIGYSVRWEVRHSTDSSHVFNHGHAETDVAGYLYKDDAYRLANIIVKDGYTGVSIIKSTNVDNVRKCFDEPIEHLSPEYMQGN